MKPKSDVSAEKSSWVTERRFLEIEVFPMIRLSVVVPVYNEEGNIYNLYLSVTDALKGKIENYEIVLVNDGSKDRSSLLTCRQIPGISSN
ncbi:glycosyltransferase [Paenibacillus ihuae]|uniref:glycosyltransferase n=1 Tax=Paenibacillus ihuae TaxID=1232431 RepID=UPI001FD75582|nr:glycosyltransferase [Paenibacillus ihuae]